MVRILLTTALSIVQPVRKVNVFAWHPGTGRRVHALGLNFWRRTESGSPLPSHGREPHRVRRRMSIGGKTVLLVEDNEDNRIVYSTILQHFGYLVMEALNGEEGIAKARAERPDLILMDIS